MSAQGNVTQVYAVPGLPVLLPDGLNRHITLGALVVSSWASVFTGGVVLACGYVYYTAFPRDRLAIKALVAACLLLSSIDMIAESVWAYDNLVHGWGAIPGSGVLPKLFYLNTVCCGVAVTLVQSAYAWRIWRLSKNLVLPGVIILLSIVQLVFVLIVVGTWGAEVLVSNMDKVLPVAYGRGIAGLMADIIITGSLLYFWRTNSGTAASEEDYENTILRRTTNGMSRIVQANSLSLISQMMTIVLFATKNGMYFLLNDLVQAKIYCFSLLILLNARRSSTSLFVEKSGSMSQTSGNNISLTNMGGHTAGRTAPGTFGGSTMPQSAPVLRFANPLESQHDYVWDGRGKSYAPS